MMDLVVYVKNGLLGRMRFFRDWELVVLYLIKSIWVCFKDFCFVEV